MSAQPQFWSDDFDMDLPKVIPEAREILGELADLELVTTGSTTHGRLNHPCCWNHQLGLVSFFGRGHPHRPGGYVTMRPEVACTLWEAVRDAWSHSNIILFEQFPVWYDQWEHFQPLMHDLRGWKKLADAAVLEHKDAVRFELHVLRHGVEHRLTLDREGSDG